MNAKQALREASKKIEELEDFNGRCTADIRAYNECIFRMIDGGSPCDYCMELPECGRPEKGNKGCCEWWLKDIKPDKGESYESEGVHGTGSTGGDGVEADK